MKTIEQLEQEANDARDTAVTLFPLSSASASEKVDRIIRASVAMMTYQLALADLATRKEQNVVKKVSEDTAVEKPKKHAGGRPSIYSEELGINICARIAEGESVRQICRDEDMPSMPAIFLWLKDKPEFLKHYTRAKEIQAESMVEDILQIADDGLNDTYIDENGNTRTDKDVVARSRLRVESRKWIASKLLPKKYGDKIEATLQGVDGAAIKVDTTLSPSDAYLKMIGKV